MLVAALTGFLSGILLNLMPCVLPILSIKLLTFSNTNSAREARKLAIYTCFGILVFMALLSLIFLGLKGSAEHITNWGFQMQSPSFISILIVSLTLFLAILKGYANIPIPAFFSNVLSKNEGSYFINGFLGGFFIVVFSATCTGPIIGTAITLALSSKNYLILPVILISMGLGLCVPYILFIFFPNIAHKIKKGGKISLFLKELGTSMILLTILWLFYILASQIGFARSTIIFLITAISIFLTRKTGKGIIILLTAPLIILISSYMQYETKQIKTLNKTVWEPFNEAKIQQYVQSGLVVLVSIDAGWCITCKGNNLIGFDRIETLEYIKNNKIVAMKGDLTLKNEKISRFMESLNNYGIPFTVIFSPKYPHGKVLPIILTSDNIISELKDSRD
jgi:suppressor for copper-sensitivity B